MNNQQKFGLYMAFIVVLFVGMMMQIAQESAPRIASETCHVVITTQNTAQASRIETCEITKEYAKK